MSTTPSTKPVGSYGIHWTSDGIAFLEQGGPKGGSNALGLRDKSPFKVTTTQPCNHLIPLAAPNLNPAHVDSFSKIIRSCPVVKALLPLPKNTSDPACWYIDHVDKDLMVFLAILIRMSSPIQSPIFPLWYFKKPVKEILVELETTNVQPLIITGVRISETHIIEQIIPRAMTAPRRLILVGDPKVPLPSAAHRIKNLDIRITTFDLADLVLLPWEAKGATLVRRYMRGESVV